MISYRAKNIKPSATLALNAMVKELIKNGEDIVNLGVGEPDFDTPDNIKQAAMDAIKEGFTKYTASEGIPELREAIVDKLKTENNLDYISKEVIVSNGAKHSIFTLLQAVLNDGDEVIIPSPYWVSYSEQVKMCGGKPVIVETDNFQLDVEKIKDAVTEKTKLTMINSPNNPTGAVYTEESLKILSDLAAEKDFYIMSDEIYEKFIYEKNHFSPASFARDKTIIINGVSKSYSMTGWRIGYAIGPEEIIKAMGNLQSQTTGSPSSISQKAALEAITGNQDSVAKMKNAFRERRNFVVKRLYGMGLRLAKPEGAFYIFPKVSGNSIDFSNKLLTEAKVAVVPGVEFGAEGYVRISYAASMEQLKKAMDRIEKFIS
jgi:aspartate aminotransferase